MEEWKIIENGIYEVSNFGRIRNINTGRILKPSKYNYYRFNMYVGVQKYKSILVHRLVAMYFCPNPDNLTIVHHKDSDRYNNHFSNLEWCTQSYNVRKCYEDGNMPSRKGADNPNYRNGNWTKENIKETIRKIRKSSKTI